ncbi:MAG: hypothetical protein ACREGL_11550, partial [Alphaproteobacteria bacterium]
MRAALVACHDCDLLQREVELPPGGVACANVPPADVLFRALKGERMTSNRCRIAALATAALLAGCAPDEFKPAPGFDGFLDRIGQVCYPDTIGPTLVRQLAQGYAPGGGGAGFMDATSNLYYGKMTPFAYRQFVVAFSDNGTA